MRVGKLKRVNVTIRQCNMVKFVETKVVFEEIPDKITLGITISNCPFRCKGCHSDYLRGDTGNELTVSVLDDLIKKNKGINCILFLGDGNDKETICSLGKHIKNTYNEIMTGIYSGFDEILPEYLTSFDYIKTGKWVEEFGPLNKETTNQRLYRVVDGIPNDITYLFWKRK